MPPVASDIGPQFDFLCAPIGEDRNGTTLSVLSALARLDVDPWSEATSLARMPREAAAERLTALIELAAARPFERYSVTDKRCGPRGAIAKQRDR